MIHWVIIRKFNDRYCETINEFRTKKDALEFWGNRGILLVDGESEIYLWKVKSSGEITKESRLSD